MSWTHLRDTTPVARKQYRCYACGEYIPIGERHVYRRGVNSGEFLADRYHVECEAETQPWGWDDWESFDPGSMPRPIKKEETSG